MNREEAKQLLPIIQAFAEGKAIEFRPVTHSGGYGEWREAIDPTFHAVGQYRIKPEPALRAWTYGEAPRLAILRLKNGSGFPSLWRSTEGGLVGCTSGCHLTYGEALNAWTRISEDGTEHPCGIIE